MKILGVVSALILAALIVSILRMSPGSDPVPTVATSSVVPPEATDTSLTGTRPPPTTSIRITDNTVFEVTDGDAEFILGGAVFGDDGYVVITNIGSGRGSLEGYALCQRPNYYVFPDIDVEPFDSVWVAVGDGASLVESASVVVLRADGQLGRVVAEGGEMALYQSAQFGAADEMVSYVRWGSSGPGRSDLAITAELWEPDAIIDIPPDAFGVVATASPPTGPSDWTGWLGG